VAGEDRPPSFDRGEDRLPELDLVTEHDDNAVEAPNSQLPEPVGDPVERAGQLGKRELGLPAVLLDHP